EPRGTSDSPKRGRLTKEGRMPEIEYRTGAQSVDELLKEFDCRKDHFSDLSSATEGLIETILKEEGLKFQSVGGRVKGRDKLRSKYLDPARNYTCLAEIPDVVGLRIITYYADKLDPIAAIISREFEVCGAVDDKRQGKPDSFGYSAIHMDCMYIKARRLSPEYKRFGETKFEIQITSILGHA